MNNFQAYAYRITNIFKNRYVVKNKIMYPLKTPYQN